MKNWILIFVLIGLSACATWTEREKQTAYIVGSIIAASIIISANDGDSINKHKSHHNHGKHHDRHHTRGY